ncbi:MAG: MoxR family ATPase [Methylococcaceae bacterium]
MTDKLYYTGTPQENPNPDKEWHRFPYPNPKKTNDASCYRASEGLRAAVNIALELGLPLLLTGEPGVGKSSVARSLNLEMGFKDEDLLHFTVKSDTKDSELFYNYDTLGRFHAAQGQTKIADESAAEANDKADPKRFIRYQALGMAILLAKGRDNLPSEIMTKTAWDKFSVERRRAVVLIDEIDKAPRDMPNDILNEIERMEFRIPELFKVKDELIKLSSEEDLKYRPIVIITSNAERPLPEAFLRRCLFYYLEMPPFSDDADKHDSNAVTVESIVTSHFNESEFDGRDLLLREAISLFRHLRNPELKLSRKPSLAEFLDWLRYLSKSKQEHTQLSEREDFAISIQAALLKNQDDQQNIKKFIINWQAEQASKK